MRLIIRLSKTSYLSGGSIIQSNKVTVLKRKSDLNILDMFGDPVEDVWGLDLHLFDDGIYEVIAVNQSHDIESGVLDGWDLKLIPYEEQTQ